MGKNKKWERKGKEREEKESKGRKGKRENKM